MNIGLSTRTAVVTGSTAGIGFAVARGLAEAGAAIVLNGRSAQRLEQALQRLQDAVPCADARTVAADLATPEGCAALVRAEPAADILVNNTGIFGQADFYEVPDEDWMRYFTVNVLSGVRLARAYLPGMEQRGWGRVVFVSSEAALNVPADMLPYAVTKTANLAVSRGLAKRMAGTGVTVNAVLPGPTLTEGVAEMLREERDRSGMSLDDTARAFVREQRPGSIIGRPATPEEVANMVVYAVSPQASATTGAALRVDGGLVETIA